MTTEYDQVAAALEAELDTICESGYETLTGDLRRILFSGGKRLRPRLAWLCAKLSAAKTGQVLPLMVVLELAHTASLVHDDVVDDAPKRRGADTIHTQRGRAAAIYSGDYLLGKAMVYARKYSELGLDTLVSEIAQEMCIGEYMQQESAWSLEQQTMEHYLLRIRRKTALFLQGCCIAGARVGGLPEDMAERLGEYGLNLGMAFQMTDDLLDYDRSAKSGKKAGQDLRCGIFNLPFLLAVQSNPDPEMLALAQKRKKTEREIRCLSRYVIDAGGVLAAGELAQDYIKAALDALSALPDGDIKQELVRTAQALVRRTY